jgi:hypothetical protein
VAVDGRNVVPLDVAVNEFVLVCPHCCLILFTISAACFVLLEYCLHSSYNEAYCPKMCSLQRSVRLTQQLQTQLVPHGIETAAPQSQVVFALSFDPRQHKMIACTTTTAATNTATGCGGDVKVRY